VQDPAPPVSAVVVNFNGGERVLQCLRALSTQDLPPGEIILVDNGSADGSPERVGEVFPAARVYKVGSNRGLPAARNAGLRLARYSRVLLIDHDLYAARDCLRRLLDAHRREGAAVTAPRIVLFPERDVVQADGAEAHFVGTMVLRHGYLPVARAAAERSAVGACPGGCLLVERDLVLAAGGFDEEYFFYLEDLEFSLRMRSLGHRLVCEPAAVVFHDRGRGTPGLAFRGEGAYPSHRAYLTLRHRLRTMLTYYRGRTLAVLLPALALYELASLVAAASNGVALQWARAWGWQLSHAASLWRRRRQLQRERILDDKALLTGGPLPLAPGFIRSRTQSAAVAVLSSLLGGYWRLVQRWIG
jgi:GT2 family glycosyltransferase